MADHLRRKIVVWLITLLPSVLFLIMEVIIWRTKRTWVSATTAATASIVDEENPPVTLTQTEEVKSPVHEPNTTTTTTTITPPTENKDAQTQSDDVVVEMKEIKAKTPQRKPMIKTPSSKASAPVSVLAKRYESGKTQQL